MGTKMNPSCLRPQIEDNFDTNSECQIIDIFEQILFI